MKNGKRILAALTTILLTLSLLGCLVPKDTQATDTYPPTDAPSTGAAAEAAFDPDAIAIELGSIKITALEMQNTFQQYISYFSYSYEMDEEMLGELLRMSEEYLIETYLPIWKAEQLGVTLSEEQESQIAADAKQAVNDERNEIVLMFAEGADVQSADELNDEQLSAALAGIDEALINMYGEGMSFDDYLAMRYQDNVTAARTEALSKLLREQVTNDNPPDKEAVDAWYSTALDAQKTKYEATPQEYYHDANSGETLLLYAPAGYVRVQVAAFTPEGEPDAAIAQNREKLTALEAEYGALALGEDDPQRRTEIESEYALLKAETDALEAAFFSGVSEKCEEAYLALNGGVSFEEVMDRYNVKNQDGSGFDERLVYIDGADTHNPGIAKIAKTLAPGEYSKPAIADGAYVIVKVIETSPAGAVDRASIEEDIRIAAKAELTADIWDEQYDAWFTEAEETAVYHRETYESLVDLYLNQSY